MCSLAHAPSDGIEYEIMKATPEALAAAVHATAEPSADEIAAALAAQYADLLGHYELGLEALRDHCRNHIAYLAEAARMQSPEVYSDYVKWESALLVRRGLPTAIVRANLLEIRRSVRSLLPQRLRADVARYFGAAMHAVEAVSGHRLSPPPAGPQLQPLAREYLDELLAGDRVRARTLIFRALESGLDLRRVYLEVLQPVQHEVGRLWEINAIGVAQEHFCTAVTQLIVSQLYPEIMARPKNGLVLVASCVGSELHEIGLRMVADFFELAGWDTRFFGGNMPVDQVVAALNDTRADLLAVSTTMLSHIEGLRRLISRARERCHEELKILAGGFAFNTLPELWKSVGADGSARNADEAVETAGRIIGIA